MINLLESKKCVLNFLVPYTYPLLSTQTYRYTYLFIAKDNYDQIKTPNSETCGQETKLRKVSFCFVLLVFREEKGICGEEQTKDTGDGEEWYLME